MARKKLTIQTKVNASTILEVVVSMVIIILVFGIAMMIYANVVRMSLSVKKIKAQAILQQTLLQAEQTNDRSTQSLMIDEFRIEQEIKPYGNLADIHLTAYDANQEKIAEVEKIIGNNE